MTGARAVRNNHFCARLFQQVLRRKRLEDASRLLQQNELHRSLNLTALVCMGVGAVVGAGVFVITGQAAARYAGPALSLSFLICVFPCLFTGLCYAELSAMVPVAGSAYTHAALALGELVSFLVAVCLVLENLVSGSAVAVSWSASLCAFLREFGVKIPYAISHSPVEVSDSTFRATGAVVNLPAVLICTVLTGVLCFGIQESAKVNNVFVAVKVSVLVCFISYGVYYAASHWERFTRNITPYIPPNTGEFGQFGVSGVLRGAGVVFFANVGFDTICATAQECYRPQVDLPRSLILTLAICTSLYFAVTLVLTGMMDYHLLNVDDPVIEALVHVQAPAALRVLVDVGAIAGLTSVCLMSFLAMPRLLLTLAKDGLVPRQLGWVHPQRHTPVVATVCSGTVGALVAGIFPLDMLGELISFGTLIAFTCVCVSLIRLRQAHPTFPRPFRTPLYPVTPVLGVIFNVGQLLMLPLVTWRNYAVILVPSFLWYCFYSRHHSELECIRAEPTRENAVADTVWMTTTDAAMCGEDLRVDLMGQELLPVSPEEYRFSEIIS